MLQLWGKVDAMRKRLTISVLVGLATGTFSCFLITRMHQEAGDFRWALHLAQRLVAHQNPYDTPLEQYPLPAAFPALPLLRLRPEIAAGIFYGISSALLALGLTRKNYSRLRIFAAYPFWAGLLTAQWSTLISASAFFPTLLPATMMKPQVGLPVFLTRLTRRGLLSCIAIGALSLIVLPQWPLLWFGQTHNYEHFIPLFVFPGPLLLLALFRYRDRDAWLLLLAAMMPQRWFFDAFTLWLIPKTRREILPTVLLSWGAGIYRWYHQPANFTEVGRVAVIFLYLPMLAVVLFRPQPARDSSASS
ncbi:MAG: hypothetical protein WCF74_24670 [Candidatus Sulfotelmatobacter sp.]